MRDEGGYDALALARLLANGANGMSDIEGKAAEGSSEREWATSEFQHFGVVGRMQVSPEPVRRRKHLTIREAASHRESF